MELVAATQKDLRTRAMQNGTKPLNPGGEILYYNIDPLHRLDEMGPARAQDFIESLAHEDKSFAPDIPGQYLVLSWENLRLAYWISYYGNWDVERGKGVHGRIQNIKGKVSINKNGFIVLPGKKIPLESLDIIDQKGRQHASWSHSSKIHAILNKLSNEIYLMDSFIYNSVMVQMLIGNTEKYDDHFELVLDKYPWNRVYRVK